MINIYDICIPTLIFAGYIQFSPQIGNVWIRNGSFRPINLLKFMICPFTKKFIWNPKMWDMNWPIYILSWNVSRFLGRAYHH